MYFLHLIETWNKFPKDIKIDNEWTMISLIIWGGGRIDQSWLHNMWTLSYYKIERTLYQLTEKSHLRSWRTLKNEENYKKINWPRK